MKKIAAMPARAGRPALAAGTLVAVSLVAAGCGGGGSTSANTTVAKTTTTAAAAAAPSTTAGTTPVSRPGGGGAGGGGAAGGFAPAASGTIATIAGRILEVQDPTTGQTTVDLTAKTAITATVFVTLSAIKTGTCISASGTKGAAGAVDATLVTVESSANGSCTERVGFGGGGGGFRSGSGGPFPSRPAGSVPARFARPTNVATAIGKVTSVSASSIVVEGISFAFGGAPASRTTTSAPAVPTTLPKAGPVTVHVTAATKYSKTARVTAASLKVGECATAIGSTNDIGVVTATRLSVSQATATGCTTGFGGFGGFRGGFGGGGGGGAGTGGAGTGGAAA